MMNDTPPAPADWRRFSGSIYTIWAPSDWSTLESGAVDLVLVGPEEPYRANFTAATRGLQAATELDLVAAAAYSAQEESLTTFLEYERRRTTIGGLEAIQREYAWVEDRLGLVLYQIQVLALQPVPNRADEPVRLIEVHATSAAPSYFRYAAMFRRMIESTTVAGADG
jgi:hypothetical protein